MTSDLVLIPDFFGDEPFIRRISDPEEVPGWHDPERRDPDVAALEKVMGDRHKRPVSKVRRAMFDLLAADHPQRAVATVRAYAELCIWCAVDHWHSPFGIDTGYNPAHGYSLLHYRGDWYERRKGGRLTYVAPDGFTPPWARRLNTRAFVKVVVESGLGDRLLREALDELGGDQP